MTFALVSHTIKRSSNGISVTTSAIDTTGASLIVIGMSAQIFPVPTDNKGNTYVEAVRDNGGTVREFIYYCVNPVVGTGHTFSAGIFTGCFPTIGVAAFSNPNTAILDQTNRNFTAGATSLTTGSVTPGFDDELIFSLVGDAITDTTVLVDSGQTLLDQVTLIGFTAFSLCTSYEIQTAATVRNPQYDWSPSARAGACIATFKALNLLTSVHGTGAAGTMVAGNTQAAEGVEGTGAVGSLAMVNGPILTGVEGEGSVGSMAVSNLLSIALSGVSALGALGNLGVEADDDVTVALTGVAGDGDVGSLGVQGSVYPPTPFEVQLLIDGPRYASIKAASTLGTPLALSVLIDPADLSSIIPGWPTDRKAILLAIDKMDFTLDPGLQVSLWWDEGTPKLICQLTRFGKFRPAQFLQNNALDPTGIILISTTGTGSFSLLMRLVKQGDFA